jgi:hypothetical protein
MKHKHAEFIKAWADGAEIEFRATRVANPEWRTTKNPSWEDFYEYRIKPEPVKVFRYLVIGDSFTLYGFSGNQNANLRLTLIDGELVEAEVLKNGN